MIIDRDADIELAAKRTGWSGTHARIDSDHTSVWGRMMNGGQQCISPDFVLCHKSAVARFCERSAHYAKTLYGADPKNNGNFGRIVGLCAFLY